MIEHSFWFLITLSFCFDAFAVMSMYHFNKRERMLNKYKTLLIVSKAFAEDAVMNEYQECAAQDLVNEIDEVLNDSN